MRLFAWSAFRDPTPPRLPHDLSANLRISRKRLPTKTFAASIAGALSTFEPRRQNAEVKTGAVPDWYGTEND
jgi:hypothetical protein